jgi:hypothetical protein
VPDLIALNDFTEGDYEGVSSQYSAQVDTGLRLSSVACKFQPVTPATNSAAATEAAMFVRQLINECIQVGGGRAASLG